ncbi:hypothetical protein FCH28_05300 [Streptomyces piniterrae]|uniref:Uncharacterized protein n=1 Tax=Streptomyces piniterrae TaxID=2571125 RepID=A0A4U0P2L0_9ACTN|nr:DUF6086 family protein [Streptomyces piniterrae]TJZ56914.1 hypothetical protein FCH28_05300 [Streptomyces piniterrae]
MSQSYDMGEQTLWNPSNGASRLFLRHVAVYEAELELPSGIGPMQADECQIDPTAFTAFVDALLARHRGTSHAVMVALSEGFVATLLVLAERAGIEVSWRSASFATDNERRDVQVPAPTPPDQEAWAAALHRKSHELGRFMAC